MKQLDPIPQQIAEYCNQEDKELSYDDFDVHQLGKIASIIAEDLSDGKTLTWYSSDRFLNGAKVECKLAEDVRKMYDLVNLTLESDANRAQNWLIEQFSEVAKEMVNEEIGEHEELPRGYKWEDYA